VSTLLFDVRGGRRDCRVALPSLRAAGRQLRHLSSIHASPCRASDPSSEVSQRLPSRSEVRFVLRGTISGGHRRRDLVSCRAAGHQRPLTIGLLGGPPIIAAVLFLIEHRAAISKRAA
jgi:hypothetical protein